MKFTVDWKSQATADLAAIWLDARDRQRLTEATARIEERLARAPEVAGESRDAGRRILHDDPLGVLFDVHQDDCRVLILGVWRYR